MMTTGQRTFILFEHGDGTRAAYEVRLLEMRQDYTPQPAFWFSSPHTAPPTEEVRLTIEGILLQGIVWQPGEEFRPPPPPKALTE